MSKQLLAKFGVFVLIAVNLGAYYMFWPGSGASDARGEKQENPGNPLQLAAKASAAQPGETTKPAATPAPAEPVRLPGGAPAPEPLNIGETESPAPDLPSIPNPLTAEPARILVAQGEDPTLEKLKRLKASFNKESAPKPAPIEPPPVAPPSQVTLPKVPPPDPAPIAPPPSAAPSAQPTPQPTAQPTTKPPPTGKSPWTLQWEINDGRTTLNAKLNKRLDFRIVCDGLKMETQDGALMAIGKVVFSGPGLQGTCHQLTINLGSDSILLEGKAELHVQQGNPTDIAVPTAELKGDRFALRLQQTAGATVPAQAPLNLRTDPLAPAPGPAPVSPMSVPSPFTVPR